MLRETPTDDSKVCGNCHHFDIEGMSGFCTLKPASVVSSKEFEYDDEGRVRREVVRYGQPVMHSYARCSKWKKKK